MIAVLFLIMQMVRNVWRRTVQMHTITCMLFSWKHTVIALEVMYGVYVVNIDWLIVFISRTSYLAYCYSLEDSKNCLKLVNEHGVGSSICDALTKSHNRIIIIELMYILFVPLVWTRVLPTVCVGLDHNSMAFSIYKS